MADETTQGVHPFTVGWWQSLPTVYRKADRVQGYRLSDAWRGLNADPRFITGVDGWYMTNTSTRPWEAAASFTRTFRASPNRPVTIRSWHDPLGSSGAGPSTSVLGQGELGEMVLGAGGAVVRVRHRVTNHSGAVMSSRVTTLEGEGRQSYATLVTPDVYGIIKVTITVSVGVPTTRDLMEAVHIGYEDATFEELPDADYFYTASAYPLLRFMDGIGHQAGFLSDMVNDMHEGRYSDPHTAPESSLLFLAAVMGVPTRYAESLTPGQLREHLVAIMDGNYPTPGSRAHIALTARQWLTGSREVVVLPAHEYPGFPAEDPLHTIIVLARADEMPPGRSLQQFEDFLNDAGVIPAGHRVVVREATQSWDAWEAAVGPTWDTYTARVKTWNDRDSIGVNLNDL